MDRFTIRARIRADLWATAVIVVALPEQSATLAEVRARQCGSMDEAFSQLEPAAQDLASELTARGDTVVDIKFF